MLVEGLYNLNIEIGGISITNHPSISFSLCVIKESIKEIIPSCHIEFAGPQDFLENNPIYDGSEIIVRISSSGTGFDYKMRFYVYDVEFSPLNNLQKYTVVGLLDFYDLFRAPQLKFQHGNSSDIFQLVAETYNRPSIIHPTEDRQTWSYSEQNLGNWLTNIASCGWASEVSGMYWFMNKEGYICYVDIDRLLTNADKIYKFVGGDITESDADNRILKYDNFTGNMKFGDENIFNQGYGGDNYQFDLSAYSEKHIAARKVRAYSNLININKTLSQGLLNNFYPFDIGNYHQNYFIAQQQNKRVQSTFSTYIQIKMRYIQKSHLSQVVEFTASPGGRSDVDNPGLKTKYIITESIIVLTATQGSQVLKICAQGLSGTSTEVY